MNIFMKHTERETVFKIVWYYDAKKCTMEKVNIMYSKIVIIGSDSQEIKVKNKV